MMDCWPRCGSILRESDVVLPGLEEVVSQKRLAIILLGIQSSKTYATQR